MPNYVINSIKMDGAAKDIAAIVELLRNKHKDNNEAVDFNNVIPMPESLNIAASSAAGDYIAAYVRTLSDDERLTLKEDLAKHTCSFYKNYYLKYEDAFSDAVSDETISRLEGCYKDEYKSINPSSIEDVGKTYVDNILNYGADTWYDWSCENWGTKWGAMDSRIEDNEITFDTAWSASLPVTAKLSEMFPEVVFSHKWADEDIGYNCGRLVFKNQEIIEEYVPERGSDDAVRFACDIWGYDEKEFLQESVDELIAEASNKCEAPNQEGSVKEDIELD